MDVRTCTSPGNSVLYPVKGFLLIPSIPPSRSLLLPRLAVARGVGLGLVLWALGRLVRDGGACTAGLGSGADGTLLKSPVRVFVIWRTIFLGTSRDYIDTLFEVMDLFVPLDLSFIHFLRCRR